MAFQVKGAYQSNNRKERNITVADEAMKVLKELRLSIRAVKPGSFVFQDYRRKLTGDRVTKTFVQ